MPNLTPPQTTAQAIETDVAAITAAMHQLTLLAVTEERKLFDAEGNPPPMPASEIGRIIVNPAGEACRATWQKLYQLLTLLIGEEAATGTYRRINAEVAQQVAPIGRPIVFPSLAQH